MVLKGLPGECPAKPGDYDRDYANALIAFTMQAAGAESITT